MTTITKGLLAAALCLMVLMLAPAAVPTDDLRQKLEGRLGDALGQPVRVGRLYLTILPRLQLVAENIEADDGALRIARASATPVIDRLWQGRIELSRLHLQGAHVVAEGLVPLLRRSPGSDPSGVSVRAVSIEDASVKSGGMVFPDIDADVVLGADGRPARINANMQDGRVKLEVLPTAAGALQLALRASDWTPPFEPGVRLDELRATALLERNRLEAWNVMARMGGGSVFGFLSVRWNPQWVVAGELSLRDVPLERFAGEDVRHPAMTGMLQAKPRFVARARTAQRLMDRLELASDFVVRDAVVRKIDLHAASKSSRGSRKVASETRFDRIAGHIALQRGRLELTGLNARSGVLVATGDVSVSAERALSGRIDAKVANTAGLLVVPLRVSGTLADPRLAPTAGAVAGAAVGSVVLPGLGTALGARAGQAAEDLLDALRPRPRRETGRN